MKITIVNIDNWGFNKYIKSELERRGVVVTFINLDKKQYQYPTLFHKGLNFITKNLFSYNLKREHLYKYLSKKIETLEKQDAILVIKGDFLCVKSLRFLKNKTTNLIAYFNDSFKRYPRMEKIYPFFDTVYSFEPNDVAKYNFKLLTNYIYFNPNTDKFKNKSKYQVFNISSLDKRDKIMPIIASYLKKNGVTFKIIAFSKKHFPKFKNLTIEVTTTVYSQEEVFKMTQESNIILDLQRPNQEGLSFRVFEAIGLEKKLITTNKSIANYDFYNPTNMVIINSEEVKIPKSFFTSPYKVLDVDLVRKYQISSWVEQVFGLDSKH